jgi:hypothetical protein
MNIVLFDPVAAAPIAKGLRLTSVGDGPVVAVGESSIRVLRDSGWSQLSIPQIPHITSAAFKSTTEGVVLGTSQTAVSSSGGGGGAFVWVILITAVLLSLSILALLIWSLIKRRWIVFGISAGVLALIALLLWQFVSLSPIDDKFTFRQGGSHYYTGENQPDNVVALTSDGGAHWRTISLPTNFYITGCVPVKSGYLVSSFASQEHLDGDLWLVLSSSPSQAALFSPARALWGMARADADIYAFGTEPVVAHIGNSWQTVPGDILHTTATLDSLSFIPSGSPNGIVALSPFKAGFLALGKDHDLYLYANRKMLRLRLPVGFAPTAIAAIANSSYVAVDSAGRFIASTNAGIAWQPEELPSHLAAASICCSKGTLYVADSVGNVFRSTTK